MPAPRHLRRSVALLLAAGSAATASLTGMTSSAAVPAQASVTSFEAIAAADGLRIEVRTPNFLVTNLFDGGAPVAQATMDSLGGSKGFASMPYPGDSVTTVPGLVLPLLGLPALPPYPLVASSIHPSTPESTAGAGAFSLTSRSDDRGSVASVQAGVDGGGLQAASVRTTAEVGLDADLGEISALARTELSGLAVAGVIGAGRVESSATVVRSGAEAEVDATFVVEGLTVAGLRVAVGADGVEVLGNDVPGLVDLGVVEPILAAAGVTMEFLPQTEIEGGIISAGLVITIPAPLDPPYDGSLSLTLGRTRAVVDAGPSSAPSSPPVTPGVSAPVGPASVPITGGAAPVARPSTGGTVAAPTASGSAATTASSSDGGVRIVALDTSAVSFYLVLAVGAFVVFLGIVLFRYFGVKLAWTS